MRTNTVSTASFLTIEAMAHRRSVGDPAINSPERVWNKTLVARYKDKLFG